MTIRVGITGSTGLIGMHLRASLLAYGSEEFKVVSLDKSDFFNSEKVENFLSSIDLLIHLAAINRAEQDDDYWLNEKLAKILTDALKRINRAVPVYYSSTVHVFGSTTYGRAKLAAQEMFLDYGRLLKCEVAIDILPHVFGPWGRPQHNSVIHTISFQLAKNLPVFVNPQGEIDVLEVGKVISRILKFINSPKSYTERIGGTKSTVAEVYEKIKNFRDVYLPEGVIPDLRNPMDLALFNTFRSYGYPDKICFKLQQFKDSRGMLSEVVKANMNGQIFFSNTVPLVERGNHFHFRKVERFCVISGDAIIRIRKLFSNEIFEIRVSGETPVAVDIPVLCTHSIKNTGNSELLTLFWASEFFNTNDSDTFSEQVEKESKGGLTYLPLKLDS